MPDVWMCSNCNQAVPLVDWFTHRENHLNEWEGRRTA